MISIVLVDDHSHVRKCIKTLLSSEPDFIIVGEADNGVDALELVTRIKPDIVILDIKMPGMSGLDVVRHLHRDYPETSTVILSMHNNEAYAVEAFRSGAKAYILKDSPTEDLVYAIREVMAGRLFLSPLLTENAVEVCESVGEDLNNHSR